MASDFDRIVIVTFPARDSRGRMGTQKVRLGWYGPYITGDAAMDARNEADAIATATAGQAPLGRATVDQVIDLDQ